MSHHSYTRAENSQADAGPQHAPVTSSAKLPLAAIEASQPIKGQVCRAGHRKLRDRRSTAACWRSHAPRLPALRHRISGHAQKLHRPITNSRNRPFAQSFTVPAFLRSRRQQLSRVVRQPASGLPTRSAKGLAKARLVSDEGNSGSVSCALLDLSIAQAAVENEAPYQNNDCEQAEGDRSVNERRERAI